MVLGCADKSLGDEDGGYLGIAGQNAPGMADWLNRRVVGTLRPLPRMWDSSCALLHASESSESELCQPCRGIDRALESAFG